MKIQISNAFSILNVYDKIKDQVIPIQIAYKWSRLLKPLQEASDFYYTELNKIIRLYGEKDENGNLVSLEHGEGVKVSPDKIEEAQTKINELSSLEVDLPDITFSLEELENFKLSLEEFNQFLPFIRE